MTEIIAYCCLTFSQKGFKKFRNMTGMRTVFLGSAEIGLLVGQSWTTRYRYLLVLYYRSSARRASASRLCSIDGTPQPLAARFAPNHNNVFVRADVVRLLAEFSFYHDIDLKCKVQSSKEHVISAKSRISQPKSGDSAVHTPLGS